MSDLGLKVACDLMKVLSRDEIALETGASTETSSQFQSDLLAWVIRFGPGLTSRLADWLGKNTLRQLFIVCLGEVPPRGWSAEQMAQRWLEKRGARALKPRIRPQELFAGLCERLARTDEDGAYALAKQLSPEVERLLRLMVLYYVHSEPDPAKQRQLILDALAEANLEPGDLPHRVRTVTEMLEKLSLTQLGAVLAKLDRVPCAPYLEAPDRILQLMTAEEWQQLRKAAADRNSVAHGKAAEDDARGFCAGVRNLFRSWQERHCVESGPVPVGAIVVRVEENEFGRECQCIDERQRSWALFGVPSDVGQADTVLLEANCDPASAPQHASRLPPAPSSGVWETPAVD